MNQITKNKADSLNQLILNNPLIQEFKKYEKTLREHPELLSLEDEIKQESQIILKKKALGELTDEELKRNIAEQQQVLLNAFFEGETKSAYCNAVVDAHQFVLSMINKGKITVEK